MATILTAKEVASKLETTPKRLRKFLRSEVKSKGGTIGVDSPGKGGRWEIPAASVKGLQKRFNAWVLVENQKRIERLQKENESEEMTDEVDSDEENSDEELEEVVED